MSRVDGQSSLVALDRLGGSALPFGDEPQIELQGGVVRSSSGELAIGLLRFCEPPRIEVEGGLSRHHLGQ